MGADLDNVIAYLRHPLRMEGEWILGELQFERSRIITTLDIRAEIELLSENYDLRSWMKTHQGSLQSCRN